MNIDILFGKTTEHLVPLEGTKFLLHKQTIHDFLKLQLEAKEEGFDLQLASAFRDYDRQLKIWNLKASGERVLLDQNEKPLEFSQLSPTEIVFAILRWSALPGCSRHHWGSDIDVFDGSKQRLEDVKLVTSECEGSGPSAALHDWLDQKMLEGKANNFFRPYKTDLGGTSPERWHLSHYPIGRRMVDHYTFSIFKKNIETSDLLLKDIVLEHADEIFQRFFLNFDPR